MKISLLAAAFLTAATSAQAASCTIKVDRQFLGKGTVNEVVAALKKAHYTVVDSKTFARNGDGKTDGMYHDGGLNTSDMGGGPKDALENALVIVRHTKREAEQQRAALPAYVLVRGSSGSVAEKHVGKEVLSYETQNFNLILAKVANCSDVMDYQTDEGEFRFDCELDPVSMTATDATDSVVKHYEKDVLGDTTFEKHPSSAEKILKFVSSLPACAE